MWRAGNSYQQLLRGKFIALKTLVQFTFGDVFLMIHPDGTPFQKIVDWFTLVNPWNWRIFKMGSKNIQLF